MSEGYATINPRQQKGTLMAIPFGRYIDSVTLWVDELTDGEIDFNDLPDEVDLGELYDDNLTPREAAIEVLEVAGFYSFTFPSED
jgi:hypothetical protein